MPSVPDWVLAAVRPSVVRASIRALTGRGGHGWPARSTGQVGPAVTVPYTPVAGGGAGAAVVLGGGFAGGLVLGGPDGGGAVPDPAVTVDPAVTTVDDPVGAGAGGPPVLGVVPPAAAAVETVGAGVGWELGAATRREVDPAPQAPSRKPAARIVAAVRRTTLLLPDPEEIFPHPRAPQRMNAWVRTWRR